MEFGFITYGSVLKENKIIIILLVATSTTPSGSFTFAEILTDGKSSCVVVPGCCYVCLLMARSTDLSSCLLWPHVALFKDIRSASSKKNIRAKRIIHNTRWQAYVELSTKAMHAQYFTVFKIGGLPELPISDNDGEKVFVPDGPSYLC